MLVDHLIKKFFSYIKLKALTYTNKNSVFNIEDKNDYFKKISTL
jgi:hypothetical protein